MNLDPDELLSSKQLVEPVASERSRDASEELSSDGSGESSGSLSDFLDDVSSSGSLVSAFEEETVMEEDVESDLSLSGFEEVEQGRFVRVMPSNARQQSSGSPSNSSGFAAAFIDSLRKSREKEENKALELLRSRLQSQTPPSPVTGAVAVAAETERELSGAEAESAAIKDEEGHERETVTAAKEEGNEQSATVANEEKVDGREQLAVSDRKAEEELSDGREKPAGPTGVNEVEREAREQSTRTAKEEGDEGKHVPALKRTEEEEGAELKNRKVNETRPDTSAIPMTTCEMLSAEFPQGEGRESRKATEIEETTAAFEVVMRSSAFEIVPKKPVAEPILSPTEEASEQLLSEKGEEAPTGTLSSPVSRQQQSIPPEKEGEEECEVTKAALPTPIPTSLEFPTEIAGDGIAEQAKKTAVKENSEGEGRSDSNLSVVLATDALGKSEAASCPAVAVANREVEATSSIAVSEASERMEKGADEERSEFAVTVDDNRRREGETSSSYVYEEAAKLPLPSNVLDEETTNAREEEREIEKGVGSSSRVLDGEDGMEEGPQAVVELYSEVTEEASEATERVSFGFATSLLSYSGVSEGEGDEGGLASASESEWISDGESKMAELQLKTDDRAEVSSSRCSVEGSGGDNDEAEERDAQPSSGESSSTSLSPRFSSRTNVDVDQDVSERESVKESDNVATVTEGREEGKEAERLPTAVESGQQENRVEGLEDRSFVKKMGKEDQVEGAIAVSEEERERERESDEEERLSPKKHEREATEQEKINTPAAVEGRDSDGDRTSQASADSTADSRQTLKKMGDEDQIEGALAVSEEERERRAVNKGRDWRFSEEAERFCEERGQIDIQHQVTCDPSNGGEEKGCSSTAEVTGGETPSSPKRKEDRKQVETTTVEREEDVDCGHIEERVTKGEVNQPEEPHAAIFSSSLPVEEAKWYVAESFHDWEETASVSEETLSKREEGGGSAVGRSASLEVEEGALLREEESLETKEEDNASTTKGEERRDGLGEKIAEEAASMERQEGSGATKREKNSLTIRLPKPTSEKGELFESFHSTQTTGLSSPLQLDVDKTNGVVDEKIPTEEKEDEDVEEGDEGKECVSQENSNRSTAEERHDSDGNIDGENVNGREKDDLNRRGDEEDEERTDSKRVLQPEEAESAKGENLNDQKEERNEMEIAEKPEEKQKEADRRTDEDKREEGAKHQSFAAGNNSHSLPENGKETDPSEGGHKATVAPSPSNETSFVLSEPSTFCTSFSQLTSERDSETEGGERDGEGCAVQLGRQPEERAAVETAGSSPTNEKEAHLSENSEEHIVADRTEDERQQRNSNEREDRKGPTNSERSISDQNGEENDSKDDIVVAELPKGKTKQTVGKEEKEDDESNDGIFSVFSDDNESSGSDEESPLSAFEEESEEASRESSIVYVKNISPETFEGESQDREEEKSFSNGQTSEKGEDGRERTDSLSSSSSGSSFASSSLSGSHRSTSSCSSSVAIDRAKYRTKQGRAKDRAQNRPKMRAKAVKNDSSDKETVTEWEKRPLRSPPPLSSSASTFSPFAFADGSHKENAQESDGQALLLQMVTSMQQEMRQLRSLLLEKELQSSKEGLRRSSIEGVEVQMDTEDESERRGEEKVDVLNKAISKAYRTDNKDEKATSNGRVVLERLTVENEAEPTSSSPVPSPSPEASLRSDSNIGTSASFSAKATGGTTNHAVYNSDSDMEDANEREREQEQQQVSSTFERMECVEDHEECCSPGVSKDNQSDIVSVMAFPSQIQSRPSSPVRPREGRERKPAVKRKKRKAKSIANTSAVVDDLLRERQVLIRHRKLLIEQVIDAETRARKASLDKETKDGVKNGEVAVTTEFTSVSSTYSGCEAAAFTQDTEETMKGNDGAPRKTTDDVDNYHHTSFVSLDSQDRFPSQQSRTHVNHVNGNGADNGGIISQRKEVCSPHLTVSEGALREFWKSADGKALKRAGVADVQSLSSYLAVQPASFSPSSTISPRTLLTAADVHAALPTFLRQLIVEDIRKQRANPKVLSANRLAKSIYSSPVMQPLPGASGKVRTESPRLLTRKRLLSPNKRKKATRSLSASKRGNQKRQDIPSWETSRRAAVACHSPRPPPSRRPVTSENSSPRVRSDKLSKRESKNEEKRIEDDETSDIRENGYVKGDLDSSRDSFTSVCNAVAPPRVRRTTVLRSASPQGLSEPTPGIPRMVLSALAERQGEEVRKEGEPHLHPSSAVFVEGVGEEVTTAVRGEKPRYHHRFRGAVAERERGEAEGATRETFQRPSFRLPTPSAPAASARPATSASASASANQGKKRESAALRRSGTAPSMTSMTRSSKNGTQSGACSPASPFLQPQRPSGKNAPAVPSPRSGLRRERERDAKSEGKKRGETAREKKEERKSSPEVQKRTEIERWARREKATLHAIDAEHRLARPSPRLSTLSSERKAK